MSGPSPTPKQDMREATADLVRIWQAIAASSADMGEAFNDDAGFGEDA